MTTIVRAAPGELSKSRDKRVTNVVAAVLGNALEFYDFTVYAAFATTLALAFFPTTNPQVGLLLSVVTFGIGFFARPLGAILIGAYSDRFGRKPAMTLTILMMALGSGMIGILPTYATAGIIAPILLVAARLIQGFSAGGEMGPATTFLIESAPRGQRAFYGSWQLASQNMGSIVSGLVGVSLALMLPAGAADSWGWRVPFLLGILIAPVGFFIRRNLDETLEAGEALESMGAVISEVVGGHWRKILLCIALIAGATISQYFFLYATTYAINSLHFSQSMGMTVNLTAGIVGAIFSVVGGILGDRFGVKLVAIVPRVLMTLLLYPAMLLVISSGSPWVFVAVIALLMAFHGMSSGCGILLIPMIFPPAIRTSGLSISYGLGVTLFGGTAQIVFQAIINQTGDKLSWIWYIVVMSVISLIGTFAIPEPKK